MYSIEMIIRDIRSPLLEYSLPEGADPHDQEVSNKAWAEVYEKKFKSLFEKCVELLFAAVNRLKMYWQEHVRSKLEPRYEAIFPRDELRRVVYEIRGNDQFGDEFKTAIEQVEIRVNQQIEPKRLPWLYRF